MFRCFGCGTALFSSQAKYDSGTGWPSFSEPIAPENVRIVEIPGLSREEALNSGIEVLFGDGPAPGKLRYCINESALHFVAWRAV